MQLRFLALSIFLGRRAAGLFWIPAKSNHCTSPFLAMRIYDGEVTETESHLTGGSGNGKYDLIMQMEGALPRHIPRQPASTGLLLPLQALV